jgi:glutathione peroxidase
VSTTDNDSTTLADFEARTITGQQQQLAEYLGSVVLVVNTASKCGLTPQFQGLENLYSDLREQGLVVLGFPCDQFAKQEFDEDAEIADFCQLNYGVTFPMFAKVDVNGSEAHPLFGWLRSEQGGVLGDAIKWNFTKFLIGRDGKPVRRYAPTVDPAAIENDIKALLQ